MMTSMTVLLLFLFVSAVYALHRGELSQRRRSDQKANKVGNRSTYYDTGKYHSFDEQMQFLEDVANKNPSFVSVRVLGKSILKRDIKYVTIGYPSTHKKPTLLIDAGIHAREWIGPAVALWFLQELTSTERYNELLQLIDIVIIPNMNPDGYEYTRDASGKHRNHRKNMRTPLFNSTCHGVDLNRNFPIEFGGEGTSSEECDDVFRGPYALSEPESLSLSTFMKQNKDIFKAYISLHSFGGFWLHPYGYADNTYPSDVQDLINLGNQAARAIARIRKTQYTVGSSADSLRYKSAGSSRDFANSLGIKYTYTVELNSIERGRNYGFNLPEEFIVTQAKEVFLGIMVVAGTIAE